MTTETKLTNRWIWAAMIICVLLGAALYFLWGSRHELAEKRAQDSVQYRQIVGVVSHFSQENESLRSALKASELARLDEHHSYQRQDSGRVREIKYWKRKSATVNTSRATVPELDSLQRSLYGAPPDDSLHTIPLDYSRKLTGDALRFPIEQRLATLWETRYDSLESHSGRLIGSYKLDLEMYRQHNEDATSTIDTLQHIAGDMQGLINEKSEENDRLRKGRNRERLIGLALIITALIL